MEIHKKGNNSIQSCKKFIISFFSLPKKNVKRTNEENDEVNNMQLKN